MIICAWGGEILVCVGMSVCMGVFRYVCVCVGGGIYKCVGMSVGMCVCGGGEI